MKNFFKTKIGIAVIILVALVIIGGTWAYYKHRTWDVHGYVLEKLDDEVDLSDEQERQLKALVKETVNYMRTRRESRHVDGAALIRQPELSAAEVRVAMDARKTARGEMRDFIAEKIAAAHAILTPEQRAELAEHAEDLPWLGKRGRHGHRYRYRCDW